VASVVNEEGAGGDAGSGWLVAHGSLELGVCRVGWKLAIDAGLGVRPAEGGKARVADLTVKVGNILQFADRLVGLGCAP
jgi:hypothetical protein